jgi:hypothetical protein
MTYSLLDRSATYVKIRIFGTLTDFQIVLPVPASIKRAALPAISGDCHNSTAPAGSHIDKYLPAVEAFIIVIRFKKTIIIIG